MLVWINKSQKQALYLTIFLSIASTSGITTISIHRREMIPLRPSDSARIALRDLESRMMQAAGGKILVRVSIGYIV